MLFLAFTQLRQGTFGGIFDYRMNRHENQRSNRSNYKKIMTTDKDNLMNCDMETGICEISDPVTSSENITTFSSVKAGSKPVRLLYFTDPICSSCWGIEPQMRKLKQEYGDYFSVEYRMGGLLKSWDEYGGSDVNGPASVGGHWNEAGEHYEMPINGDLWKEDPLDSSYPPSIAFKAAQLQGNEQAERFLRKIKEMVLVEKKNITKWEHLAQAAADTNLDLIKFRADYKNKANDLFQQDLSMRHEWGVRGFPTIFFIDEEDNRFKVYGSKPYEMYEQALLKLAPGATKTEAPAFDENVLKEYGSITTKEFAVLNGTSFEESEIILNSFADEGKLKKITANTGHLWRVII